MPTRKKSLLYILLANALWGVAPSFIKLGLETMPPLTFLFLRFIISTVVILPFFIIELKKHPIKLVDIPTPFFIGIVCYTVSLSLVFLGVQKTTALDSSLIGSIEPIVVCLLGAVLLGEVLSKNRLTGIIISLLGTLLIILEPFFSQIIGRGVPVDGTSQRIFGNLLIALYLISNGIYVIATRKYFKKKGSVTPFIKVGIGFIAATITLFPLAMLELGASFGLPTRLNAQSAFGGPSTIVALLYMALLSGLVAYLLCEKALQKMEATDAVLFTYLQPLFAVPVSYLLLGEKPTMVFLLGAVVIVVGIYIAEGKNGVLTNLKMIP